jgi:shikimate kinase
MEIWLLNTWFGGVWRTPAHHSPDSADHSSEWGRMIIVLNGPLGIGKSALAESLAESIDGCVMLDGDHLVAANPPPADEVEYLHSTVALLVAHHRRFGYRHFVIDHLWRTPAELDDLRRRLLEVDPGAEIRCFLLTLPLDENLRRIERRQGARALDEQEFELQTVLEEREALFKRGAGDLGTPFDVSAPPADLVAMLLHRLGLREGRGRCGNKHVMLHPLPNKCLQATSPRR